MIKNLFENTLTSMFVIIFMLGQFPGGTIVMALSCQSKRLDGWDWVLSVVIPFFGLFKALFSEAC